MQLSNKCAGSNSLDPCKIGLSELNQLLGSSDNGTSHDRDYLYQVPIYMRT